MKKSGYYSVEMYSNVVEINSTTTLLLCRNYVFKNTEEQCYQFKHIQEFLDKVFKFKNIQEH